MQSDDALSPSIPPLARKSRLRPLLLALVLAGLALGLDQWSKLAILADPTVSQHQAIEVTSFFNLVLVFNHGVSFGMFAAQKQPLLLTILALGIIALLLRWLWKTPSYLLALGVGFTVGGALGNVIDRVRYGAVVDFLDVHLGTLHWPAFNIADSFVFIGVVVLSVHSMFFDTNNAN